MSEPRRCRCCNDPAVWRWVPPDPLIIYKSLLMCDDHAARFDLEELESLHLIDQAEAAS